VAAPRPPLVRDWAPSPLPTGGRLVCLQSGTQHLVGIHPLVIGRCGRMRHSGGGRRRLPPTCLRAPYPNRLRGGRQQQSRDLCELRAGSGPAAAPVRRCDPGRRPRFPLRFRDLPSDTGCECGLANRGEPPVQHWPGTGKIGLIRAIPPSRGRFREWIARYGIAEVLGAAAAFGAFWLVRSATDNRVAAAYAAALAEGIGFYLTLLLGELIRGGIHGRCPPIGVRTAADVSQPAYPVRRIRAGRADRHRRHSSALLRAGDHVAGASARHIGGQTRRRCDLLWAGDRGPRATSPPRSAPAIIPRVHQAPAIP
jgi:hypothetical protein